MKEIFLNILKDENSVIVFIGNISDINKLNICHPNLIVLNGFIPFTKLLGLLENFQYGILTFNASTLHYGFSSSKFSLYRVCGLKVISNFEIDEEFYLFGKRKYSNKILDNSLFLYESHTEYLKTFIDAVFESSSPYG